MSIKYQKICQELLFARNVETDTKDITMFYKLEKFYGERSSREEYYLSCYGWRSDYDKASQRIHSRLTKIPGILNVHYVIYRLQLGCHKYEWIADILTETNHQGIISAALFFQ